jgi:hypothetical protein
VRPYIRATCNPDADSWVAEFVTWWIDQETGIPIPERAGVLRYYVRVAEKIVWADQPEDLIGYLPPPQDLPPGVEPPRPISVTFIPASVADNPALGQPGIPRLAEVIAIARASGCWLATGRSDWPPGYISSANGARSLSTPRRISMWSAIGISR